MEKSDQWLVVSEMQAIVSLENILLRWKELDKDILSLFTDHWTLHGFLLKFSCTVKSNAIKLSLNVSVAIFLKFTKLSYCDYDAT